MQRQQPAPRMCFTAPMPSGPVFPSGPHYTFPHPYQDVPFTNMQQSTTIQYINSPIQPIQTPMASISAPPSALPSPALPNEVYFSPFAHEYTSYFSVDPSEAPTARRNTPFVHRRSRVVMACTYCRRRKIRCNGGEPCGNCAKTGRNCDYTPVPADSSAPRRRRAFEDNGEPSIVQKETSREGSLASRGGDSSGTILPESSHPAGPFATGTNPPLGMVDANAYLQQPTGTNETGLLSSGFSYVPPLHGAQQMEWALVPVWRSSGPETASHQLLAPPPGFSASRMAESTPRITIPQSNGPSHMQGSQVQGISCSTSANGGAQYQHIHSGQQPFGKAFGFAANQMQASMNGPEPAQSRLEPIYNRSASEDPRYGDTPMLISDFGVSAPQPSCPLPSPSAGTSFSSNQDFASSSTSQARNQSLSSPPYTPLPSTSIGSFPSRPSTANMAHGPSMEGMKQGYPPVMFMHMPPGTPAFEHVNQGPYRSNMLGPDVGMVGLGIMMPGM